MLESSTLLAVIHAREAVRVARNGKSLARRESRGLQARGSERNTLAEYKEKAAEHVDVTTRTFACSKVHTRERLEYALLHTSGFEMN